MTTELNIILEPNCLSKFKTGSSSLCKMVVTDSDLVLNTEILDRCPVWKIVANDLPKSSCSPSLNWSLRLQSFSSSNPTSPCHWHSKEKKSSLISFPLRYLKDLCSVPFSVNITPPLSDYLLTIFSLCTVDAQLCLSFLLDKPHRSLLTTMTHGTGLIVVTTQCKQPLLSLNYTFHWSCTTV